MAENVVIFGEGQAACTVAHELMQVGIPVFMVSSGAMDNLAFPKDSGSPQASLPRMLPHGECVACRGIAGDFYLQVRCDDELQELNAGAVILALDTIRESHYSRYGLHSSNTVVSLSDFSETFADFLEKHRRDPQVQAVAFLHGLAEESHPVMLDEILANGERLQTVDDMQTFVFYGNLKVAGAGLEARYRAVKEAGAVFVRFGQTAPELEQEDTGRVHIRYTEELTGETFSLSPDMLVVDESIRPSAETTALARILDIEIDGQGFAQADNVHRLVAHTNRRGIYTVGPSRSGQMPPGDAADARSAALLAWAQVGDIQVEDPAKGEDSAAIDAAKCVRCLTCLRVCNYEAVKLAFKPAVTPLLCERCGICAAECPAGAIRLPGLEIEDMRRPFEQTIPSAERRSAVRLRIFSCSRSAYPAGELYRQLKRNDFEEIQQIKVPCAGAVSYRLLLDSFEQGIDGILVLSCHADNCHSGHGYRYARNRIRVLRDRLASIGIQPERLAYGSLAANMAAEYGQIVGNFQNRIREIGTTPIA